MRNKVPNTQYSQAYKRTQVIGWLVKNLGLFIKMKLRFISPI